MAKITIERGVGTDSDDAISFDGHRDGRRYRIVFLKEAVAIFWSGDAPPYTAQLAAADDFYGRFESLADALIERGRADAGGVITITKEDVGG